MRQYVQAVLERKRPLEGVFQTEPYEAAWASEAIFFIRVDSVEGTDAGLKAKVQISADGRDWIDEGAEFPILSTPGSAFTRVSHFGGWLRLAGDVSGRQASFTVTIHLILKE